MPTPQDSHPGKGQDMGSSPSAGASQVPATFMEFLKGRPFYEPAQAPMSAWLAAMITAAIVIGAQFLAIGIDLIPGFVEFMTMARPALPAGASEDVTAILAWNPSPGRLMRLTLISQIVVVALTLLAARRWGLEPTLRLHPPTGGWRLYAYAFGAMLPIIAVINGLAYLVAPTEMFSDFKFFLELAREKNIAVTALAIGAGAPLSEELLFRGFLLTALSASALGYWRAAIFATLAWTALHFSYSWVGLTEVFCIGLYFSWLLWRTGSLLPPLLCHALYNSSLLVAMRFWPQ